MAKTTKASLEQKLDQAIMDSRLADYPEFIEPIFKSLDITPYLNAYNKSVEGAKDCPNVYHGKTHSLQVVLNAYEAALNEGWTYDDKRVVLLAALFHDHGHSHGRYNDSRNVKVAANNFQLIHADIKSKHKLSEESALRVSELIIKTQYPYKTYNGFGICGLTKLLRDADIMSLVYTTDRNLRLRLFVGFINEIGIGRFETIKDVIEFQNKFLWSIRWSSRTATIKAMSRNWPQMGKKLLEDIAGHVAYDPINFQYHITHEIA